MIYSKITISIKPLTLCVVLEQVKEHNKYLTVINNSQSYDSYQNHQNKNA